MRKNSPILVFTAITLTMIFAYCKKESSTPYVPVIVTEHLTRNMDTARQLIQGKWEWLQEEELVYNGSNYQTVYTTPQTLGYTLNPVYSNDTSYGFKNGIATGYTTFDFKLEKDFSNDPSDSLPVLVFYDSAGIRKSFVPYLISKNYLLLQYQYVSSLGGQSTLKKIN